jgi:RHS repeat-associated protein
MVFTEQLLKGGRACLVVVWRIRGGWYYSFSWAMPSRKFNSGNYRFGFNGKENDRYEWGNQLIQDYGFRLYNPAIGKFLSFAPLASEYPWNAPYSFAENSSIKFINLDGLEKANHGNNVIVDGQYKPVYEYEG